MKRILLHLGLPKTGTTTLQHHLFQRLHEQGLVNFLGKALTIDLNGKVIASNYRGKIIRQACEGKIQEDVSVDIDKLLSDSKLNVLSDEGIMVFYPGMENLPLNEKLKKLAELLSEYDVEVFVSLRQPVEYLYSLYTELYTRHYSKISYQNSFKKYVENFLETEIDLDQESAYMHRTVELISHYFKTKVLLFDTMKADPMTYSKFLAGILTVDESWVFNTITSKQENRKQKSRNGVYTKQSISLRKIKFFLAEKLVTYKRTFSVLRAVYFPLRILLTPLESVTIARSKKLHKNIDNKTKDRLMERLGIPESFSVESYGLSKDELKRYGYYKRP